MFVSRVDPNSVPGERLEQTSGKWLVTEMESRGISNLGLFRAMQTHGYTSTSCNIVSLWRGDKSAIGTSTIPTLLRALGMNETERRLWAWHFLHERHPELVDLALGRTNHSADARSMPIAFLELTSMVSG